VSIQAKSLARHVPKASLADEIAQALRRQTVSFHALPLSFGGSLRGSALKGAYQEILGTQWRGDLTVGAPYVDSFFFPKGSIAHAEARAASVFGADATLFLTAGTTLANQIAVESLASNGTRVLIDKATHQSIHFSLDRLRARVDYIESRLLCLDSERTSFALIDVLSKVEAAEKEGDPYRLLILNGQSYDGVIYNISTILRALSEFAPSLRNIIVDEAWGSWSYLDHELRQSTAIYAARLPDLAGRYNIIATQSAHKSLSALRQGSLIHAVGDGGLGALVRAARYKHHTTSPNFAILASLDLACAQAETEGVRLVERAIRLASELRDRIAHDPLLDAYFVNETPSVEGLFQIDPSKISLNVSALTISPAEIRDVLYREFDIYINRTTVTSLLLNFHIGINEDDLDRLSEALRAIQKRYQTLPDRKRYATGFVIPYPPGVPLMVPGDEIRPSTLRRLHALQASGINLFTMDPSEPLPR
jgi:arginine/lysine/ornithine decarboxylase